MASPRIWTDTCLNLHHEPETSSPVECAGLCRRTRRPGLQPPPAHQVPASTPYGRDRRAIVVSPAEARTLLSEIAELTPALHAFFACLYFGGLRPSEAANLRRINLKLPTAGWGEIVLLSSYQPTRSEWTDDGRAGEERSLKHRAAKATRRVPAHPELVVALHQHLSTFGVGSEDRLFVSRTGRGGRPLAGPFVRPVSSASTSRVLQRARAAAFTTRARGLTAGSAPLRPAPCLPVHLAGGWSPAHPSCRLGRSQRGGAAAGLRPRPRRPGRSVQASDSRGA